MARPAPHSAAARTAPPVSAVDWVGAVSAVTAPTAGARTNPVTAQTTAKRPALPVRAVIAAMPAMTFQLPRAPGS